MFVGTTPPEVRLLLQELLKNEKAEIFVGCSGNFSSDKILSGMGLKVHSNDVCLYSKLISDILLHRDTDLKITNEELAGVFSGWEDSTYKKLIQVMFAIKVSQFHSRKNDYQRMMFASYVDQAKEYYTRTIEKFERSNSFEFQIQDFYYGDFVEHLRTAGEQGAIGVAFPPTYKGGYEKIFSFVESSFEYERAKYNIFDPKEGIVLFKDLLDNGRHIIYSDKDYPELEKYKSAKVVLGSSHNTVYVYSSVNISHNYYFERSKNQKPANVDVVSPDFEFLDNSIISVKVCPVSDINYFKAFYMANKVNYTTGGDFGLIFFVDGKAFGFTSFSKRLSGKDHLFMQSDFVVNSHTSKLSKLLIMLSKSREVRRQITRLLKHYYRGLRTTVYTDKPVSMKYRGVYELERRDKGKLMYKADFIDVTLNEIYKSWVKKYKKNLQTVK